jgi:hypothetical protein
MLTFHASESIILSGKGRKEKAMKKFIFFFTGNAVDIRLCNF